MLTLPATVMAYQQTTLYAKVAGYLKKLNVDKGDAVKEGDALADIEVPELLADEIKFKAEVDVAAVDYRRVEQAQAKAPDLVVPQSVDAAKGKLEVAKANLERNETLLRYARLTAPFSGVITRRWVDPGAFIPAAASGSTPQTAALLELMDFSRVRVQVPVPELEVPWITNGVPVRIRVEELPRRVFEGGITRYAHVLDDATKTMLAEVELPNPDRALRPGMYAIMQIAVERKPAALLLPVEAVLFEKNKASVFTEAGSKARKVAVKTGFNDGTSVEILEGLSEDQPVLLAGKQTLTDGQQITVKEAP
jgi:membrane fusion protein (multidrug efflux system)